VDRVQKLRSSNNSFCKGCSQGSGIPAPGTTEQLTRWITHENIRSLGASDASRARRQAGMPFGVSHPQSALACAQLVVPLFSCAQAISMYGRLRRSTRVALFLFLPSIHSSLLTSLILVFWLQQVRPLRVGGRKGRLATSICAHRVKPETPRAFLSQGGVRSVARVKLRSSKSFYCYVRAGGSKQHHTAVRLSRRTPARSCGVCSFVTAMPA
jgi:hypothetical protein